MSRFLVLRGVMLALCVVGLSSSGCMRYTTTPVAVFGPYQGVGTEQILQIASSGLVSRGYQILSMDAARGQLTVQTRTRIRFQPTTIRVQVFREGWVQIVPQGAYVQNAGSGRVSMPSGLVDEYVDMTVNLMARVQ